MLLSRVLSLSLLSLPRPLFPSAAPPRRTELADFILLLDDDNAGEERGQEDGANEDEGAQAEALLGALGADPEPGARKEKDELLKERVLEGEHGGGCGCGCGCGARGTTVEEKRAREGKRQGREKTG